MFKVSGFPYRTPQTLIIDLYPVKGKIVFPIVYVFYSQASKVGVKVVSKIRGSGMSGELFETEGTQLSVHTRQFTFIHD